MQTSTMRVRTRKVFERFNQCPDDRAWDAADNETPSNGLIASFPVSEPYEDPEPEYLRQYLLRVGAKESDGYVILILED